jgi:hypothetical protein
MFSLPTCCEALAGTKRRLECALTAIFHLKIIRPLEIEPVASS